MITADIFDKIATQYGAHLNRYRNEILYNNGSAPVFGHEEAEGLQKIIIRSLEMLANSQRAGGRVNRGNPMPVRAAGIATNFLGVLGSDD